MIDIRFLRENPEIVKQNIRNKFQDHKLPLVDEVIALDEELRAAIKEANDLRASRNALSKQHIRVDVPSRFTVGISTENGVMQNAAERLLGIKIDEIKQIAEGEAANVQLV